MTLTLQKCTFDLDGSVFEAESYSFEAGGWSSQVKVPCSEVHVSPSKSGC
jgi:hypothetical protein